MNATHIWREALDQCRSSSARRRSGISRTSRCACSPSCARQTSCCARTRATRAGCCSGTRSKRGFCPTTSTTRRRARRSSCRACKRASASRSCPMRACPASRIPAARIVRAALDAGVEVTVLPGPSAVETALVASGLVGERYQFVGFLPRGAKALSALWDELRCVAVAGRRVRVAAAAAGDVALARGGRSRAAGRRLPRVDEALRGDRARDGRRARGAVRGAAEGRDHARDRAGAAREVDEAGALAAVAELVEAGLPRKRAAELVARLTGAARNRLYRGSL